MLSLFIICILLFIFLIILGILIFRTEKNVKGRSYEIVLSLFSLFFGLYMGLRIEKNLISESEISSAISLIELAKIEQEQLILYVNLIEEEIHKRSSYVENIELPTIFSLHIVASDPRVLKHAPDSFKHLILDRIKNLTVWINEFERANSPKVIETYCEAIKKDSRKTIKLLELELDILQKDEDMGLINEKIINLFENEE